MELSLEQIKKLVKDRPKEQEINRGIKHQNRLKFHTDTVINKFDLSSYRDEFIDWICSEKPEILPADKVERFKQLLTVPLGTVQLTESISLAWSRVFEGEDKFFRYDFEDSDKLKDWEQYRDKEFFEHEGFQAMLNAIDSVWVVDLPIEQEGDLSEPKHMLIDINNVIDLSTNSEGECHYLIFALNEKLFVYDDVSIRVFEFRDKTVGNLLSEFKHELDYCPARMFWTTRLGSNFINKKAPLTNVLSELDWLLVHKTFKKYMDIANSYPILVTYKMGDDYQDLRREDNKGRSEGANKTMGGALVGPGTILQMNVPMEGQPDLMSNPVKWIAPETTALEFHVGEGDRMSDYIFKTCVGIDGEQSNDQAKNEKQVLASFESQSIILRRLAMNFEKIQTFAEKTIIQLRYGMPVDVSIYYGSRFFLKTEDDLTSEIDAVKGDDLLLNTVYEELIETKFRNDTGGKLRARAMRDLDPAPGKNVEDILTIYEKGGISETDFKIKCNFMAYILRFEREQLPIEQFLDKDNYNKKIGLIKQAFITYASEWEEEEKPGKETPVSINENNE